MLASPPARESKAMRLPSGDQCGDPVILMPNELSCMAFEPSESETQTSWLPDRLDWKAIWVPSGEIFGAVCSREELTTFRACAYGSERSTRQIFTLLRLCLEASPTGPSQYLEHRVQWVALLDCSVWPGRPPLSRLRLHG